MNDDLISRSALKKSMWDESYSIATFAECGAEISRLGLTITEIEHIIDNAPTVEQFDDTELQRAVGYSDGYLKGKEERPQGEWICKDTVDGHLLGYSCSNCRLPEWRVTRFCPNCGADMRGERI